MFPQLLAIGLPDLLPAFNVGITVSDVPGESNQVLSFSSRRFERGEHVGNGLPGLLSKIVRDQCFSNGVPSNLSGESNDLTLSHCGIGVAAGTRPIARIYHLRWFAHRARFRN